jgi:hypothetical protein
MGSIKEHWRRHSLRSRRLVHAGEERTPFLLPPAVNETHTNSYTGPRLNTPTHKIVLFLVFKFLLEILILQY